MNSHRTLFALVLLCCLSTSAYAAPILISLSADDPQDASWTVDSQNAIAVSWTSLHAYTDVTISARLQGTATGTAALTTQIGPGTTVAHELATASFTENSLLPKWVVVLTGLNLGPGTFYLTLGSLADCCSGWGYARFPALVQAPGVAYNGTYFASSNQAGWTTAYWPANPFLPGDGEDPPVQFIVEGTPVPEPSIVWLLSTGVLAVFARRRPARVHALIE